MNSKNVEILLVEDNPGDVELTRIAFEDADLKSSLNIARDGEEAIEYLFKRGEFENVQTPDVILLDLNLPKKDGREVLVELGNDVQLKQIPTIVLSSSSAEKDINESYELNANCYVTKPSDAMQYIEVVKVVESFWTDICKLPPKRPSL